MDASEQEALYLAALDEVERATTALRDGLDRLLSFVDPVREQVGTRPFDELVLTTLAAGGSDARRQVHDAVLGYERAVREIRGACIWLLVEHHGKTFAEMGRAFGISPQMARRLYAVGAARYATST